MNSKTTYEPPHSDREVTVLVFKTDISTDSDYSVIEQSLSNDAFIQRWNVDMEDVDKVLRVLSYHQDAGRIIRRIMKLGFRCEELQ